MQDTNDEPPSVKHKDEPERTARGTLIALAAVALALFAVLAPPILRGETAVLANPYVTPPFTELAPPESSTRPSGILDSWRYTLPTWDLAHRAALEGTLPLWNPYVFCGHDNAGSIQPAVFSPVTIALSFLPAAWGMTWHLVFHTILLGLGTVLFLRGRGLAAGPSAFGGIALALSGYLVAKMGQPTTVATFAWLPLALRFQDEILSGSGRRAIAGYALALALAALSGHPQVFLLSGLVLAIFGVRPLVRSNERKRAALGLALGLALGAAMSAVQLAAYRTDAGTRSIAADEDPGLKRTSPLALWGIVVAEPFGSKPLGTYRAAKMTGVGSLGTWHAGPLVYQGAATLLTIPLVLIALLLRRCERERLGWALEALALALFAYGAAYVPWLTDLVQSVPGLGFSRIDRILLLGALGTALAAAAGVQALLALRGRAIVAGLAVGAAIVVPLVLHFLSRYTDESPGAQSAERTLLYVAIVAGALALSAIPRLPRGLRPWLLVLPLGFELVPIAGRYLTTQPAENLPPESEAMRFLADNIGSDRFVRYTPKKPGRQAKSILPANTGQLFGLRDAQGFAPIFSDDFRQLYSLVDKDEILRARMVDGVQSPKGLRSSTLRLLGVRYVLSSSNLPGKAWEEVFRGEGITIWESTRPVARARLAAQWSGAASDSEALDRLRARGFDFESEVILQASAAGDAPPVGTGGAENTEAAGVRFIKDGMLRVDVEVTTEESGLLVLADGYHPGWRAWVDGEEAPVFRADLALRAVEVPAGTSTVSFRYRPTRLLLALGVSGLLFLACLALMAWPTRARRPQ